MTVTDSDRTETETNRQKQEQKQGQTETETKTVTRSNRDKADLMNRTIGKVPSLVTQRLANSRDSVGIIGTALS